MRFENGLFGKNTPLSKPLVRRHLLKLKVNSMWQIYTEAAEVSQTIKVTTLYKEILCSSKKSVKYLNFGEACMDPVFP